MGRLDFLQMQNWTHITTGKLVSCHSCAFSPLTVLVCCFHDAGGCHAPCLPQGGYTCGRVLIPWCSSPRPPPGGFRPPFFHPQYEGFPAARASLAFLPPAPAGLRPVALSGLLPLPHNSMPLLPISPPPLPPPPCSPTPPLN